MPSMIQKCATQPMNSKCSLESEEQLKTKHLKYKSHLFIKPWQDDYSIKTKRETLLIKLTQVSVSLILLNGQLI